MRLGELLKLQWVDVDFDNRVITVRAQNTKTERERQVSMTLRMLGELASLRTSGSLPSALVFGFKDNVRTSYENVRAAAGLPDVRFHDLRHTAATRLVSGHLPLPEVGRILGHTQPSTTYRYVNANVETAKRAAAVLDAFNSIPAAISTVAVALIH